MRAHRRLAGFWILSSGARRVPALRLAAFSQILETISVGGSTCPLVNYNFEKLLDNCFKIFSFSNPRPIFISSTSTFSLQLSACAERYSWLMFTRTSSANDGLLRILANVICANSWGRHLVVWSCFAKPKMQKLVYISGWTHSWVHLSVLHNRTCFLYTCIA